MDVSFSEGIFWKDGFFAYLSLVWLRFCCQDCHIVLEIHLYLIYED